MKHARVVELAARQHNRFSRGQVRALGWTDKAIKVRLESGQWVAVHEAVYAIAPALDFDLARWTAATLTETGTVLSHVSAAAAWGIHDRPRLFEVVTRPGDGGPRRHDGLLVHRSATITQDVVTRAGLPVSSVPRTLLDLASHVGGQALARLVREALRLRLTSVPELIESLETRHRGRRGSARLRRAVERHSGLPVARCRSAAEVRALEILRDAGRPAPDINRRIAGEEADLSWRSERLIIEIDGAQFHLDAGEDERKQRIWEHAGWTVRRLATAGVFDEPGRLLDLAPPANVAQWPS
jgi:hypothetical protein